MISPDRSRVGNREQTFDGVNVLVNTAVNVGRVHITEQPLLLCNRPGNRYITCNGRVTAG
jgi:hypothetical protein